MLRKKKQLQDYWIDLSYLLVGLAHIGSLVFAFHLNLFFNFNSDSCQTAWSFSVLLLLMQRMLSFRELAWPDPHYLLDKLASISKLLPLFNNLRVFSFSFHHWSSWHILDTDQSKLIWIIAVFVFDVNDCDTMHYIISQQLLTSGPKEGRSGKVCGSPA